MTTIEVKIKNTLNQQIKLPDGRKLGFATYGDPEGFPVLAFHGTPGSRLWFEEEDTVSGQLGIRLITTDRPGYGMSGPHPDRTLLDYPQDIAFLLEELKIERCSVIGTSGGSIFAAACAFALPEKIYKAGLIAGVGEFEKGKPPKDMCRENRFSFNLARNFPRFARLISGYMRKMLFSNPEKYIQSVQQQVKHLCEADQKVMQDPKNASHLLNHLQEANRQGVRGIVQEMQLVTLPWGFSPEEIKTEVEMWHGTKDTLAPVSSAQELAKRIPDSNLNLVADQGHFIDADPEIWEKILRSVSPN